MRLSSRVKDISESITLKLNSKAEKLSSEGKTIYNLTAGQLPFMPESSIVEALKGSLNDVKSFQYTPTAGYPALRQKVIADIEKSRKVSFKESSEEFDCIISDGAKHSIMNALYALLDSGDEVVFLAPYWISYPEMARLTGATPVIVGSTSEQGFIPEVEEVEKAITDKTRVMIINSPNNPSGVHYPKEWMEKFTAMIKKYPEVTLISDEIYYQLDYAGEPASYFYQYDKSLLDRTVIIDGISKSLACTGLRIGYCVGPKTLISHISRMQGHTTSGASSLVQRALLEFDFSRSEEFLKPIKEHLSTNCKIVSEKLNAGFYKTTSAFYYMIDFTKYPVMDRFAGEEDASFKICEELLEKCGVAVVPGTAFGVPNSARISLVLETDRFSKGLDLILDYLTQKNS